MTSEFKIFLNSMLQLSFHRKFCEMATAAQKQLFKKKRTMTTVFKPNLKSPLF